MPVPPKSVREAAARGLERRKRRSKTTKRPGGTAVGVARARDLKGGRNVSESTLKRMRSFFQRHDTAAERAARARDSESPASIAWDLWGGDPGRRWASSELERSSSKRKSSSKASRESARVRKK